jgi:serine/threonine protein kinase
MTTVYLTPFRPGAAVPAAPAWTRGAGQDEIGQPDPNHPVTLQRRQEGEMNAVLMPSAVLASNTSGLQYTLERRIGEGSFGQVWLCRESERGQQQAVKIFHPEKAQAQADEVVQSRGAVHAVGECHVPRFYGACEAHVVGSPDFTLLAIAMEFIDGASARELARGQVPMPETITRIVLHDVSVALARLHECGIVHLDVKTDNILVGRNGKCYLADSGVTQLKRDLDMAVRNGFRDKIGTPVYMAPELLADLPQYNEKVDIWSLGIAALEMCRGRTVIPDHWQPGLVFAYAVDHDQVDVFASGGWGTYSAKFAELLSTQMLQRDPTDRCSAVDLLLSRYLRGNGPDEAVTSVNEFMAEVKEFMAERENCVGSGSRSYSSSRSPQTTPN